MAPARAVPELRLGPHSTLPRTFQASAGPARLKGRDAPTATYQRRHLTISSEHFVADKLHRPMNRHAPPSPECCEKRTMSRAA